MNITHQTTGCEKVDELVARAIAGGLEVEVSKQDENFVAVYINRRETECKNIIDIIKAQECLALYCFKSQYSNRWSIKAKYRNATWNSNYEATPMKMVKYHLDFMLERN